MRRFKWMLLALAAVMALAVACSSGDEEPAPTTAVATPTTRALASNTPTPVPTQVAQVTNEDRFGGELRVVSQSSVKSIDRDFSTAYVSAAASMHIHEGLFKLDRAFISQPEMVDKWELSTDALTYTFTILDNRVFHNSDRKVTTDDVIPSMKRGIMRHPYGKPMQNFIAKAENSDADNGTYDKHDDPGWAKVFEKVDDRTFKMHLTQPYGAVVTHWGLLRSGPLVWQGEVAELSALEDVGQDNVIGSGPYRLDRWNVGDKLTYARHARTRVT